MRPGIRWAMICALAAASPAMAASGHSWGAYGNDRYNYAICYPDDLLTAQGESDSGDGQVFSGRDGAELRVYGANDVDPLQADLAATADDLAGPGARITYRVAKANWLVASGAGAKGEFYLKRFKRRDQTITFEFIYPAREHALYAPVVAHLVQCFTIGGESGG